MKKRLLGILLVVCMVFSLAPRTVFAEREIITASDKKNFTIGTSAISADGKSSGKWDYIYFGNCIVSKYGISQSIKWRVLSKNGSGGTYSDGSNTVSSSNAMFLLSEYAITGIEYNKTDYSTDWNLSDMKKWCDTFFHPDLKDINYLLKTSKTEPEQSFNNKYLYETKLENQCVFPLSYIELIQYVGNEGSGDLITTDISSGNIVKYWLRTPQTLHIPGRMYVVFRNGIVSDNSAFQDGGLSNYARPAINIDSSKILFTTAAVGGKDIKKLGTLLENESFSGDGGYKLTMVDSDRSNFKVESSRFNAENRTVEISCDNISVGWNEYISAMVKNGDTVKYYGIISKVDDSENNTFSFSLPHSFDSSKGDTLYIFNEQINGDENTDYSSNFIPIPLNVAPSEFNVDLNTNHADSCGSLTKYTYGIGATLPIPVRSGYRFDGWYETEDFEDEAVTLISATDYGDKIYYAKWTDITKPTGEINLGENSWNSFFADIKFDLFFKNNQEVTVTADDNSAEEVKIEYYISDEKLTVSELDSKTFSVYSDKINIEHDGINIVYVKLTDSSQNYCYINSNAIIIDSKTPIISGITDKKTYCSAQTVTVSDENLVSVTVNNVRKTLNESGQFILEAYTGAQKIVVTDKAGNKSEVTVTVNGEHNYKDVSANGKYWKKCEFCGDETPQKDIPTIEENDNDTVIEETVDSNSPKTGDSSHITIWFIILFISVGILIITVKRKKFF